MRWIITKAFNQLDVSEQPFEDVTDMEIGRYQEHNEPGYKERFGFVARADIEKYAASLPYTFRLHTAFGYLCYEGKASDCTSADALLPREWLEKTIIVGCRIEYLQESGAWLTFA